jgi:hypothetical protein
MELNDKLAEFTGIIIGDGCLYRKQNLIMITGNIKEDSLYYENIRNFIYKIIKKKPKIRVGGRGLRLIMKNKDFFNFFYNYLEMRYEGNKTYTVVIPSLILKNLEFTKSCLRGIADTDGSIFTSNKPGSPNYPSIEITTVSKNLAFQIRNILEKIGYRATLRWYDPKNDVQVRTYKIGLNGWLMLKKWYYDIGFSHPMKMKKLKVILDKKKVGQA